MLEQIKKLWDRKNYNCYQSRKLVPLNQDSEIYGLPSLFFNLLLALHLMPSKTFENFALKLHMKTVAQFIKKSRWTCLCKHETKQQVHHKV